MPTPPYAQVTASINAGAYQSGGLTVPSAATLALAMASTVGVTSQLWEVYSYPDGWTAPAGWTRVGGVGTSYQSNAIVPPLITLPPSSSIWGKWMLRLTANGNLPAGSVGLVDEATAIRMLSPNGLDDFAFNEGSQFSAVKGYVEGPQVSFRAIDAVLSVGATVKPAQSLAASGAIVPTSPDHTVALDVSGGAAVASMPAIVVGQRVTILDPTESWAGHQAGASVGAGISIENPAALGGGYTTNATLNLPLVNGTSITWEAITATLWKIR